MPDNRIEEHHRSAYADPARIASLINSLGSMNDLARHNGRMALVRIGKPAEPALIQALHTGNHLTRWGAVKALAEIADPEMAPVLVKVLEDDVFDIRWIASEGLIALGMHGLEPLLQALVDHPDLASLREGSHHVLHMLGELGMLQLVCPVLDALEGVSPATKVPPAAHHALEILQSGAATPD